MVSFRQIAFVALAAAVGCPKSAPGQGDAVLGNAGQAELQVQGRTIFLSRCFVCHGVKGDGQGPAATGLGANPRDFTDPAWQRSTTDDRIRKVIREGGEAIGENSAMSPNPDLQSGQVESLLAFVRSLVRR